MPGVRGASRRLLLEHSEAVPDHLLHEDATVALRELAACQEVLLLEPCPRHQRVAPHLVLKAVGDFDRLLHSLHLGDGDGLNELKRRQPVLLEGGGELGLTLGDEGVEERELAVVLCEDRLELRHVRESGLALGCPASLRLRILLGGIEEPPPELKGCLRNGDSPREEALPDHVEHRHPLHLLHILVALDVGKAVEEGVLGQQHLVEADRCVIEVVADSLPAHVLEDDARYRLALLAEVHDKSVRTEALALDEEVGYGDSLVRY
mmetsp:Transcript_15747/g.31471  ORF Transcript_15747/g.31471 Transcript_15747/m.31471 type:complete len:264 (+) Transcript_15747:365-1156(+)